MTPLPSESEQPDVEDLALALGNLGHPTKLRLFNLVKISPDPVGPTTAAEVLSLKLSTVSCGLNRLHQVKVLDRHTSGRYCFYTINPNFLAKAQGLFNP